jgi:hypothetical protein
MAVLVIPYDTSLQLRFVIGMDEESKPIIKSKTYNKVKSDANDQDVFDVANQLVTLQKYSLDEIRRINYSQLTE